MLAKGNPGGIKVAGERPDCLQPGGGILGAPIYIPGKDAQHGLSFLAFKRLKPFLRLLQGGCQVVTS